jgi:hypothetical protein
MNTRPDDNGIDQEPQPRREDPHPANPERQAPGQQPGEQPRQDPGSGPDREPDRRPRQD